MGQLVARSCLSNFVPRDIESVLRCSLSINSKEKIKKEERKDENEGQINQSVVSQSTTPSL
jgi:hypothetical protein